MNDDELKEAISISLFTEKGWWGDSFNPRPLGSNLHLLDRMTDRKEILQKSKDYTREALIWLVEDGNFESITVDSKIIKEDLEIEVVLHSKNGTKRILTNGKNDFSYA